MNEPPRCPTCRASWRAVAACPRCGTDLAPLMRITARAWQLREAARAALDAGRVADACALAGAAFRLHATPRGWRMLIVSLLAAGRTRDAARALAVTRSEPGSGRAQPGIQ